MRSFNGIKGAERNTPPEGLILEITNLTGESLYIVHIGEGTKLTAFVAGNREHTFNELTVCDLIQTDKNGGL